MATITLPDEAVVAVVVAELAEAVRTIDKLALTYPGDKDDKKDRKALIRILHYYTTKEEFEKLKLHECKCKNHKSA
jgi:hypothetical protein